jgi:uncharacterized protein YpmB
MYRFPRIPKEVTAMRKHSNFGFSSILLTFVMICIITFSALTLLTANSDYRLSRKVADRNNAYYEAQETAYEILSETDTALAEAYSLSSDRESYYRLAAENLSENDNGTLSAKDDQSVYAFEVSISEEQYLQVELLICYPENAQDAFYQILKWQSIHVTTTAEDQNLNLIGSDE